LNFLSLLLEQISSDFSYKNLNFQTDYFLSSEFCKEEEEMLSLCAFNPWRGALFYSAPENPLEAEPSRDNCDSSCLNRCNYFRQEPLQWFLPTIAAQCEGSGAG